MTEIPTEDQIDLTHIIVKPLYFGMLFNVTIPMILLVVIYFLNNKSAGVNHVGDSGTLLLYTFVAIAALETAAIIWWREKQFKTPMIRSAATFEYDFGREYLKRCKPLFLAISTLSLYGFAFYFLTGRFKESAIFVLLSYVVFQLVRPRHGLVQKLVTRQRELVGRGEFLKD